TLEGLRKKCIMATTNRTVCGFDRHPDLMRNLGKGVVHRKRVGPEGLTLEECVMSSPEVCRSTTLRRAPCKRRGRECALMNREREVEEHPAESTLRDKLVSQV